MRRLLIAAILAVLLVLCTAGSASAERGCVLNVLGIKVCGTLLTPLPTVTVTLPPVHTTTTITVPGPTRTVTLPGLPGVTRTVLISGPPGATVTKTLSPPAVPGPTVGPGTPQSTVTKTVTISPSGQQTPTRDTIGTHDTTEQPLIDFNAPNTPGAVAKAAGIGLLSLLALVGIILAGMAYAFRVGRRSKDDEDTEFMRALLDSVKSRGKHS